jgi:hypothetical protein
MAVATLSLWSDPRTGLVPGPRRRACRIPGLAEECAKVIYNDSVSPMPFDRDSGWSLLPGAISIANDLAQGEELRKAALSFKAG